MKLVVLVMKSITPASSHPSSTAPRPDQFYVKIKHVSKSTTKYTKRAGTHGATELRNVDGQVVARAELLDVLDHAVGVVRIVMRVEGRSLFLAFGALAEELVPPVHARRSVGRRRRVKLNALRDEWGHVRFPETNTLIWRHSSLVLLVDSGWVRQNTANSCCQESAVRTRSDRRRACSNPS